MSNRASSRFSSDPAAALVELRRALQQADFLPAAPLFDGAGDPPRIDPALVRRELDAALSTPGAAGYLRALDRAGLLDLILPELRPMKGCTQPKEHYWDVFDHTIEAVAALDWIWAEIRATAGGERPASALSPNSASWLVAELTRPLPDGADPLRLTRWSTLLHDIAKPATKSIQPNGRTRFFGHSELGAELAHRLLGRLGYPETEIVFVARLIDMHLRPGQIGHPSPTDRAVRRLFRDAGEGAAGLLILNLADHAAALGPRLTQAGWQAHLALIDDLVARRDEPAAEAAAARLVTGHDLMDHLRLPPGPLVGSLLARITAAQASGEVTTRAAALSLAEELYQAEQT